MSAIATPERHHPSRPAPLRRAWLRSTIAFGIAFACCAAGLTIAQAHPLWPLPLLAAFTGWCVLAALRPDLALAGLLALLPLAGFAPRTGWLIVEEFDLLVLATAAGGYAARAWTSSIVRRRSDSRFEPRLSIVTLVLLGCYLAATMLSMQRGVEAAGGFTFAWTQGFNGPLNSVRSFKGIAWALLLAPLVLDELRRSGGADRIGRGLTIGLGLAGLAVVQERYAYVGLLDFTQDYRATGSFWEMHVGGATLDAFILLTVPFAVREALRAHHRPARLVAVFAVLGLAAYATLATFSRGLYLAIAVEAVLLAFVALRRLSHLTGFALGVAAAKWALFGVAVAIGDVVVFRHGGYRGVIATLAVLAMALRIAPLAASGSTRPRPVAWLGAVIAALALAFCGYGVASLVPKGTYVVFAIACAASVVAIVHAERRPSSTSTAFAIAAWLWACIAACVVSGSWGGPAAGQDSAVVIAVLVAFVLATARVRPTLWRRDIRLQSVTLGLALLIVAPVTVLSAGAYMSGRLEASHDDFRVRADHWAEAIGRLRTPSDWLLGLGLGRYPATSLFSGGDSVPGTYAVVDRADGTYAVLSAPGLRYLGDGVFYRLAQVVPVVPDRRYVFTVRARAEKATALHIDLCEKHLIYSMGCLSRDFGVPADAAHWTTLTTTFDSGGLGRSPWFAPKAMVLSLAVAEPRMVIEVQDVELRDPNGTDLVANGRFHAGSERWFPSSDLNHGPFHTFNFAVGVLIDQGLLGLVLLALLVVGVLVRTVLGRAHRHPDAAFVATAIIGVLVLGLVDDPFDAPRIAFLFLFVVTIGLILRNPKAIATGRAAAAPPTAPPMPASSPTVDEAAERAMRRRRAFGARRTRRPDEIV